MNHAGLEHCISPVKKTKKQTQFALLNGVDSGWRMSINPIQYIQITGYLPSYIDSHTCM